MSVNAGAGCLQAWPSVRDPVIAYAEWRMSCTSVWAAYREWCNAPKAKADLAYAAYMAALDREHAAARAYSELTNRYPGRQPTPR
jgi:hypothetical protein